MSLHPPKSVEPKAIRVWRFVCPGCKRSASRREVIADHLTRCWKNPDNRACPTCAHFDRGRCCRGASDECGCGGQDTWACAAGVPLSTGSPVVGCELWVSA